MPNRLISALALGLAVLVPAMAQAHEAAKGRHGGWRVDAGKYHTELVVDGTPNVTVYLSDADDKPLPAAGFKATAIFIIDGKSQRFALAPADGLEAGRKGAGTGQAWREGRRPTHSPGWIFRAGQVLTSNTYPWTQP
jgi:hypothetical protein